LAVTVKALRQQVRDRVGLALFLFTAPFFVAFYRLVFSGEGATVDFEAYVPSLIVFSVIMLVFSSSIAVARERDRGTLERMRMTPLRPVEYLAGTSVAQAVLGTVAIALTFGVAVMLGFDPRGSLVLAFVLAATTGIACIGIGVFVASLASSVAQAFLIGSAFMFLLVLFSGIVFPLPAMATFSLAGQEWGAFDLLPTVHAVRGLHAVLVEGAPFGEIEHTLAALVVLAGAYFAAGWLRFAALGRTGPKGAQ
jgi:ABC-2 type transport system permease protein